MVNVIKPGERQAMKKKNILGGINVYTFKEPDNHRAKGQWGASASSKPFEMISGFGDTELEALKEFCIALEGAIEVMIEDTN